MLKVNKMAYYAIKGMLAEDAKSLELIISRLGFIAAINPNLGDAIVNGVAIDAKVKDPDLVRSYLNDDGIIQMNASIQTYAGINQSIKLTYLDSDGTKRTREFYLSNLGPEEQNMFEIEYMQCSIALSAGSLERQAFFESSHFSQNMVIAWEHEHQLVFPSFS